jgi:hypothetical protein
MINFKEKEFRFWSVDNLPIVNCLIESFNSQCKFGTKNVNVKVSVSCGCV